MSDAALLKVRDLRIKFVSRDATLYAVNGIDFDLARKETLCILGESGSGKSVTLRSLMRLHPPKHTVMNGSIEINGDDVVSASEKRMSDLRGRVVSMVFQEPMTALDPVFTIGRQIAETVMRHEGLSRADADRRALDLLDLVQIPSAKHRLGSYPHEFSGGLRQRAMIAIALSCRPALLLADEPTTALDATVQIQVLLLLRKIQAELGMGIVFVTHDLGVASEVANRIAVMYAGRFIEDGPAAELLRGPKHPYLDGLLGATVLPGSRGKRLTAIPGAPPSLQTLPAGCSFAPRCAHMMPRCVEHVPDLRDISNDRRLRCVLGEGSMLDRSPPTGARMLASSSAS